MHRLQSNATSLHPSTSRTGPKCTVTSSQRSVLSTWPQSCRLRYTASIGKTETDMRQRCLHSLCQAANFNYRCGIALNPHSRLSETRVSYHRCCLRSVLLCTRRKLTISVKTASYSFSASCYDLPQNANLDKTGYAEHEYGIRFDLGQTV